MRTLLVFSLLIAAGCTERSATDAAPPSTAAVSPIGIAPMMIGAPPEPFDAAKVRTADVSVLFVGNSHTSFHDLPTLIGSMMQFQQPTKTVATRVVGVGHLEDAATNPQVRNEIEAAPWTFVVLQAQKISVSGKFEYSRKEGIDLAKLAKSRGATVFYYSEWGLRGVAGDGPRNEKIYTEMAAAAGVGVAPVGRAWDIALAKRPELPLYAGDGNHQSAVGAFVTACVLAAKLTGESPAGLAAFAYDAATAEDRKLLAEAAAEAVGK